MLVKFAAVLALCLPTLARSEIVEFTCTWASRITTDETKLLFDTTNQQVKWGEASWSDNAIWGQDYITWVLFFDLSPIGELGSGALAYMFERSTGKLVEDGVSPNNFNPALPDMHSALNYECRRPF